MDASTKISVVTKIMERARQLPSLRDAALAALSGMDDDTAPILLAALSDTAIDVGARYQILHAANEAGKFGVAEYAHLTRMIEDGGHIGCQESSEAALSLRKRLKLAANVGVAILDAASTNEEILAAIEATSSIPREEYVSALLRFADHADQGVKIAAVRALIGVMGVV